MRRLKNTIHYNCNQNGFRVDLGATPIKMLLGSTKHVGKNIELVWPVRFLGQDFYTNDGNRLYHLDGMEADLNDIKRTIWRSRGKR